MRLSDTEKEVARALYLYPDTFYQLSERLRSHLRTLLGDRALNRTVREVESYLVAAGKEKVAVDLLAEVYAVALRQ